MMLRRMSLLFVFSVACTFTGSVEEPEETSTTSSGTGSASDDPIATGQSDDGHTSMTGAATGVSATDPTTASTTANPTTAGDDDSASDTGTTGVGDTGTPREQCGIELPDGGNYEAGCGCETCDLYWTELDYATFEAIIAACECLCDAADCGAHNSAEAAGAASGEDEGSMSDSTASTGTDSTTAE